MSMQHTQYMLPGGKFCPVSKLHALIQATRSYALLTKDVWLECSNMLQKITCSQASYIVEVTYMYLSYSLAQLFHSSLVTCVSCLCWSRCGLHRGWPPLAEGEIETFTAIVWMHNNTVHAVVEIKEHPYEDTLLLPIEPQDAHRP